MLAVVVLRVGLVGDGWVDKRGRGEWEGRIMLIKVCSHLWEEEGIERPGREGGSGGERGRKRKKRWLRSDAEKVGG